MKTILLTLSVVALFSACTTGEKMSSLEPGMTRQQVVGILGRPNAVRSNGPYEQLEYTHRLITGWSWDRSDFKVILKDGRVIELGHGEVRETCEWRRRKRGHGRGRIRTATKGHSFIYSIRTSTLCF